MDEQDTKLCPACGGTLECKLKNLSIGPDGGGGLASLFYSQYEVDLYACPTCGKVELYNAVPTPPGAIGFDLGESKSIVCSVCDTKHSILIGCPSCALHNRRAPKSSTPSDGKKKPQRKPPWER